MSKKTILFLHGLGQSAQSWEKTATALSVDYKTKLIELSDFCDNKEWTYQKLYSGFETYCANNKDEPLNLCGISLGAILALNYAIRHPEKMETLVLIAPQYKMPAFLLGFQNLLFRYMPENHFQEIGFSKDEILSLCASMKSLDFSNELPKICCPTLIICGKKDWANKRAARIVADKITWSKLYYIDNANHEINKDVPDVLAKALMKFYAV